MEGKEILAIPVEWAHTFRSCDWVVKSLRLLQLQSFNPFGEFSESKFEATLSRIKYTPAPIALLSSPTNYDLFLRVPIPEGAKSLRDAIKRMAKTFLVDTFYGGNRYRLPLPAQEQEAQLNLFARPPDPDVFDNPGAFVDSREALDWIRNSDLQFRRSTARSIWEAVEGLRNQERGAAVLRRSACDQLRHRYAAGSPALRAFRGPRGIPAEVRKVKQALIANLQETLVGERAAGLIEAYYEEDEGEWLVGTTHEGHDTFVYKDGQWYMRQWWGFRDDELLGDLNDALAAARMFFTG